MATATANAQQYRPAPVLEYDDRFVALAADLGARCAERAADHDRDNTFVSDNYELLRQAGYTALAIPPELGGLGA